MNDIIRDIKARQTDPDAKPGAVIIIPPGGYELHTQVVVDVSFLTIAGYGHGFTSLGIAYNSDTSDWHERKPGGSHVKVLTDGPALLVHRDGSPRLSGIVFRDFCLDGLSFTPDQNSYANGKTGIEVSSDNDAFHITGMGFVYLERALVIRGADALRVHDNFIVECGSCLEMTGAGQATLVTNNLMGAGPHGPTILAENHEGLLVTGNNLFPRGRSLVELHGCVRSSVTANRMQGFYPGMVRLVDNCKENLVTANHFRRAAESYQPFIDIVGLDDLFGVVFVRGDNNLISNNLFAYDVAPDKIIPTGGQPTMILVAGGTPTSSPPTTSSATCHHSMSCSTVPPHGRRCSTAAPRTRSRPTLAMLRSARPHERLAPGRATSARPSRLRPPANPHARWFVDWTSRELAIEQREFEVHVGKLRRGVAPRRELECSRVVGAA